MTDIAFSEQQDDLVARIASGDREAFARLYRECRPDVYRFALHMSGTPALAEDVVQDVFLAVIGCACCSTSACRTWTATKSRGA